MCNTRAVVGGGGRRSGSGMQHASLPTSLALFRFADVSDTTVARPKDESDVVASSISFVHRCASVKLEL